MHSNNATFFLDVGSGHQLFINRIGNINCPTIIYLHGGPGLDVSERDQLFFDFEICNVIFFDQRGCGRSKFTQLLDDNTTQDQIKDIDAIADYFDLYSFILFGGSWGSTLSLYYALHRSEKILGLILRGLFTATLEERKHFETGGNKGIHPHIWNRFKSMFPSVRDENIMDHYMTKILSKGKDLDKHSLELSLYGSWANDPSASPEELISNIKRSNYVNKCLILSHYSKHNFFIPNKYIRDHVAEIRSKPIAIVHGRNDGITLLQVAEVLANEKENIQLIITEGGHSPFDSYNLPCLSNQVKKMINQLG